MPERRTHGREFFAGQRQRDCLSRFSVHFFRRVFLNRMGQVITGYGRPLSVSMPNRAKSGIRARFPLGVRILLRNSRRKRSTENPGHAIPLPPSRQKLPPVLCKILRNVLIRHYIFLFPAKARNGMPCSGLPLPPCAPLAGSFS